MRHSPVHNEITIGVSKTKLGLMFIISIAFVVLGFWIYPTADLQVKYPPTYVRIVGLACIVGFGGCAVRAMITLFTKRVGLILNEKGFVDSYSGLCGFIPWKSITAIEIMQIRSTKLILIRIKNSQDVINRQSKYRQFWMKLNLNLYGSVIFLSSNVFTIKFEELLKLMRAMWERHR